MALQKKLSQENQLPCNCVFRLQATESVSKMKLQDLGLLIQWNIIYNLAWLARMEVIWTVYMFGWPKYKPKHNCETLKAWTPIIQPCIQQIPFIYK